MVAQCKLQPVHCRLESRIGQLSKLTVAKNVTIYEDDWLCCLHQGKEHRQEHTTLPQWRDCVCRMLSGSGDARRLPLAAAALPLPLLLSFASTAAASRCAADLARETGREPAAAVASHVTSRGLATLAALVSKKVIGGPVT